MRIKFGPGVSMIGVAITFVMGVALPIGAHHSYPAGQFNDTFSDVQGVVKEVRLTPPHAWIMLEVKADGASCNCGLSKERALRRCKESESRRITSKRATPSKRAAAVCGWSRKARTATASWDF